MSELAGLADQSRPEVKILALVGTLSVSVYQDEHQQLEEVCCHCMSSDRFETLAILRNHASNKCACASCLLIG